MKLLGDTIDYVGVFDSDFQPPPDFLKRMVPYLIANPTVGWVQVRCLQDFRLSDSEVCTLMPAAMC